MTRYKILDDLLSNRYHNYSLDDLTEEVNLRLSEMYPDTNGVVRRTIEKDIFYLEYEGPFLVDIERYSVDAYNKEKQKSYTKQCLRYANPAFSIFKKQMSADEEYLLSEALTLLGQFDGLPNLGDLEALRLGLGVRKPKHQIISLSKNPLESSNILGELFTAISQRQTINLHYHTFKNKDVQLTVTLFPYMLKEYNRRWFLVAAAESDGKLLTFGLDRIDDVENLPSHKYVDYDGDLNELYEDIIGVTYKEESPVYKIVLWVSDNLKFRKFKIEYTKSIKKSTGISVCHGFFVTLRYQQKVQKPYAQQQRYKCFFRNRQVFQGKRCHKCNECDNGHDGCPQPVGKEAVRD